MRRILLCLLYIILPVAAIAQTAESEPFNGLVVDVLEKGIKAKISIKHTSLSTTSDKQGKFGFSHLNENDTLVVKYKKANIEIPVNGRKSLRIKILEDFRADAEYVPELVDLGYGYVSRREQTDVSRGITGELFSRGIYQSLPEAIKNSFPGVTVNEDATVVIRGVNSLLSSSTAMILVDGMEVQSLLDVNVYDIASVEISYDGAMYGVRGSNGVIIIKTKRN